MTLLDVRERERRLRDALALQRVVEGVNPDDRIKTLIGLSYTVGAQGRYDEAEVLANEALDYTRSTHQKPHALLVHAWHAYGSALFRAAQYEKAAEAYKSALETAVAVWGPTHVESINQLENLATVQLYKGHHAAAEASYREILRLITPIIGENHPTLHITLGNLGAALYWQKKYGEAEAYYRQALDVARKGYGSSHPDVAHCLGNLGQALDALGRFSEATATLRESVSIVRGTSGNDSPVLAVHLTFLSGCLRNAGSLGEAEATAREALAINAKLLGSDHPRTREAEGALGLALVKRRRWDEAEPLLMRYATALALRTDVEGDFAQVVQQVIDMYKAQGKPEKVQEWRSKLDVKGSVSVPPHK
jgi:tetratricopeptide (TPR) repeat protein